MSASASTLGGPAQRGAEPENPAFVVRAQPGCNTKAMVLVVEVPWITLVSRRREPARVGDLCARDGWVL